MLAAQHERVGLSSVPQIVDFADEVTVSIPFPGRPPFLIQPTAPLLRHDLSAAVTWMAAHRETIEAVLLRTGAILWRGFPVTGPADFATLMGSWPSFSKGYVGGASDRKPIAGQVMEATRTPPDVYILLHQEMSYLPFNPRLIAFFCRVPAARGGNTVIGDMSGALEALPPDLARRLTEHGIIYRRHLRNGEVHDWRADPAYQHPTWQYWFDSTDRDKVSAKLAARGLDFEWQPDGGLLLLTHTPAVTTHPVTGEVLLFNQLCAQFQHPLSVGEERVAHMTEAYGDRSNWPFSLSFGDGTPVTEADFMAVHREMSRREVSFAWQAGDVLLLDNKLTAHGRTPFQGERDVQVMLLD